MGAIKELCPQMSYCVVNRRRVYTDRRELRLSSSSVLDTDDCCDIAIVIIFTMTYSIESV